MDGVIKQVRGIVSQHLEGSAHDLEHVFRVYQTCLLIAAREGDLQTEVLELAALLHDIARADEDADNTGRTDHAVVGADRAAGILLGLNVPAATVQEVAACIRTHRFRSSHAPTAKEAQILFDADKIDVLGAIGVARTYAIAGQYSERLYADVDLRQYIATNLVGGTAEGRIIDMSQHAPNIEYETKFRRIPAMCYTASGRAMAAERLRFMEQFFERMKLEVSGQC
ncbi:MAG: HD domain-containing protein [Armatimonadota bacterium]|jgi:uncharacterized protein